MKRYAWFGIVVLAAALAFSMAACSEPMDDSGLTAADVVAQITVGWNLGNTFDAGASNAASMTAVELETAWLNPKTPTTRAHFAALKGAGFNAVRIPVTWSKVVDRDNDYAIRADWMARVKEVVDYAIAEDMFILLNTHHDTGLFRLTDSSTRTVEQSLTAFEKIWEQIAKAFKDYDERLIFEALNEPRTPGSQAEWGGGTIEERDNLNVYYQRFVDTVRKSGGNNGKRMLMVNTYGASAEPVAMYELKIPKDKAKNKIIVSYHAYEPYNFALNTNKAYNTWDKNKSTDTSPIRARVDRAYSTFVNRGIPVIMGEFAAMNKDNEDVRAEWAEYYVSYAKSKGIPCFWWDNGNASGSGELFGLLNRSDNTFHYPKVAEALVRGSKQTE